MIGALVHKLSTLAGVDIHSGIEPRRIDACENELRFRLPPDHSELLKWSNGVECFYGYFRLFGLRTSGGVDALVWNAPDCWKFAWGDRCARFWCFGETVWGDQYAYALDSLRQPGFPPIWFLDGVSMSAEVIAGSFAEFVENEFLRNAREPYDKMILQARTKLGRLDPGLHLVHMPSLLLAGTEDIDNVVPMNARSAMICNGDLAMQLEKAPADASVHHVEYTEDECGRMRLKVVWSQRE